MFNLYRLDTRIDPGGTFSKFGRTLICLALLASSTDALLRFNQRSGGTFLPDPSTVNSDSILEIKSLTSAQVGTFAAGDCFTVEVNPIDSYEQMKPGYYKPFPYPTMEVCDFTPAATCIRESDYKVKILLTESGNDLVGKFGKMKNPFSLQKLSLQKIKYYDKCITITEKESTGALRDMSFRPGIVETVDFKVSKQIIGAHDVQNTATFKFKPASTISELGGRFVLQFPPWYSALQDELKYAFDSPFSCESPNIAQGLQQYVEPQFDTNTFKLGGEYIIIYERITGTMTDEVTIICKYFKNPIVPEVVDGFKISTQDVEGVSIDSTRSFSLDATNFAPYEALPAAVRFTVSDPVVQKKSAVTLVFNSLVPFEYDGCYVKFTFPPEVGISSDTLKAYTGEAYMVDEFGNKEIVPVDKDLNSDTKWVIFKACQYNLDGTFVQSIMQIKFEDIILPYAKRKTSVFPVQVYKSWTKADGLSKPIIFCDKQFMDEGLFETNDVENIVMTATNYQVQEGGTHIFEFTTTSIIPGLDKGSTIQQAINIKFPPSLKIDESKTGSDLIRIDGAGISVTDISHEKDETLNYDPECQLEICYTIFFKTETTIAIGSRIKVEIDSLLNPESIIIAKDLKVATLMRYQGDPAGLYYKIDTATQASKFQAQRGVMDTTKIYAQSVYKNFSTFSDNQVYLITYTSLHKVYKGGFVKLEIPESFIMSSSSSAVAQYSINDKDGVNYVQINAVSQAEKYIIGQSIIEMAEGKEYTIKIGGLQNPRNLITNEDLPDDKKQYFKIKTYDQESRPIDDAVNIIDYGEGALVNINVTSKIQSFSAESYNTSNGAETKYYINWFTEILTLPGDFLIVEFPAETQLKPIIAPGSTGIKCTGLNGIITAICTPKEGEHHQLQIELAELSQATGLFKLQVENVVNPPSLRGSGPFGVIKHVTKDQLTCSTYDNEVKIETEYASELQGLGSYSISQNNKEYAKKSSYSITFVPNSRHQDQASEPLSILLSYPVTVRPWDDAQGCTVVSYNKAGDTKTSLESDCKKPEGSRLFKITNAIPYGYDQKVTININFYNPKDNWGTIGLKIKTFEIYQDNEYLMDQIEGNQLIPNLKCLAPCMECKGDTNDHDLRFCDRCWQNNPIRYLMEFSPYSVKDTSGNSTCLSSCPGEYKDTKGVLQRGYTSNGDEKEHRCVQCDPSCATCQDNGKVGDTKKCVKCAKTHPFMFTPESRCMESCSLGYYQLGTETCDLCSFPCQGCSGDKFNCNKCDPKGTNPALFSSIVEVGGKNVTRATCRTSCPNGYFLDRSIESSVKCGLCTSPCSNCEDAAHRCTSCNGEGNKYYVYRYSCYEECPDNTAPDMSSLQCIDCSPNCKKCGTMDGPNCFECVPPFLLEDGVCVKSCTKPGFRPNLKKTICVDKAEFPDIGPLFSIISIIIVITVFIAKKLKKETEPIPSIIGMLGVVQFVAIAFQVFLCAFYSNQKYLIFTMIAFFVLIGINLQNAWYINVNVRSQNAQKQVKLSKKKVDMLYDESVKKEKRRAAYEKAMANMNEGGEREQVDLDDLSDIGDSISQRGHSSDSEQYDGGMFSPRGSVKKVLNPDILAKNRIEEKNGNYYMWKQIDDRGFIKWEGAYDRTAVAIQWISLFTSFKFYRMTYSFFMGRKQFLVLYQKKKFKKMLVIQTLFSMFFVELVIVICGVMGAANLPRGNQLYTTLLDSLCLCIFLLVVEFVEIARLDLIMRTVNTTGKQSRKSATACQSSEDEDFLSSGEEEEDDDWPDWRLMLKNVEGNRHLFEKTKFQLQLNKLEKKLDLRIAESCIEFNTGTDKEKDPRQTRSFPTSPTGYKNFDGFDFRHFGETNDNCYAESKAPGKTNNGATYSEMGTQAQPSEILTALARKGGDLLTPNTDNDYIRRGTTKKKRGRKNKYYRQIDAEDDEEADQMSEGSEDDGLDGIKEEDEEDEEERLAKLAKIQAERDKAIAEQKAKEEAEKKAAEDAKKKAEDEAAKKKADAEAAKKAKEDAAAKAKADAEAKAKADAAAKAAAEQAELDKKRASAEDNGSELSGMMVKSGALKNFSDKLDQGIVEVPPTATSRRFNECDILGRFDRDEKGNVIVEPDANGNFKDKDGKPTNERGYLVDKDGNIINNYNGQKMFDKSALDGKGEVPAPFNVEKHNFNPHQVRGEFDFDRNGNPMIKKTKSGEYVDKRGQKVSARGYRLDKDGNVIDHQGRVKFDKSHVQQDGDLPKFYNYNGRRFDITDIVGIVDKDANGQIIPLTDKNGNITDNLGRKINSKGYLIDDFGNIIDKDGRQIFEKKHLYDDEPPKILPFTKFNVKNVLGDFEMDPLGNPILENVGNGNYKDRIGQKVNQKGYMIDKDGNIINKNGKIMFAKELLDNEQDIPKVFRTGLLKSDTASSLSRLMSEIGKNQPSEFDQEEQRIQEEIANNLKKNKRNHSGNTSVDSMMEDTPANYNYQNQRFNPDMEDMEGDEIDEMDDDDDEYGSQYDVQLGQTGFTHDGVQELAKKRRKKKKKKKKKKPVEYEDPSLREHLLAGAYGGVAKKKPKRIGVKYTTDLNAGLRDITTPGSAFMRDPSKKMMTSFSGFDQNIQNARESHRNRTNRRSEGVSEIGSNIGSRIGGRKQSKMDTSHAKLMDPQQREDYLKQTQMNEIKAKKLAAAKKRRNQPGKISKDADFEKMFGKDIDEFLEDSEWDIESIDKMSQFSKNSKNTIHSAAQAGKLRGLEKLYLQRIETSMNAKNTLQQTGVISQTNPAGKQPTKKGGKFRGGDLTEEEIRKPKQAWDVASKGSRASQSVNRVFKQSKR